MSRTLTAEQLSADGSLAAAAMELLSRQQRVWALARDNYAALKHVRTREIDVDGLKFRLQFNPTRIVSTAAKIDPASIAARPCFLCDKNLPAEQKALSFGIDYLILVNPFAILPAHFTIPTVEHVPQRVGGAVAMMLELTRRFGPDLFVFYNGPKCGASAPDHMHFQAGAVGMLPIETEIDDLALRFGRRIDEATTVVASPLRPIVLIESNDEAALARSFAQCYAAWAAATITQSADEPMMNVLSYWLGDRFRVVVLPRTRHRPSFYFAEGERQILISPASLDLGGLTVVPREKDFDRITADDLRQMLREVCPSGDDLLTSMRSFSSDTRPA